MGAQNFSNHRHLPLMWLVTQQVAVIGSVLIGISVIRQQSVMTVGLLLLGLSVIGAVITMRRFALRLQDRIIRLEMQTRLARLGRVGDFGRVTLRQLIALRFASDAELPLLLNRAITENLTTDQIKRAIITWQADYMRS